MKILVGYRGRDRNLLDLAAKHARAFSRELLVLGAERESTNLFIGAMQRLKRMGNEFSPVTLFFSSVKIYQYWVTLGHVGDTTSQNNLPLNNILKSKHTLGGRT